MVRVMTSSTPNSLARVPKSTKVGVVSMPSVFHGRSYGAKSTTTLSQNTRKINLFVAEVCWLTFGLCGWNVSPTICHRLRSYHCRRGCISNVLHEFSV